VGRRLILNDGTELQDSYVISSGSVLWVYVYARIGFAELFDLLNDRRKTARVTLDQEGTMAYFDGYTDLFCIRKEDGGFISAGLRKEV